MDKYNLQKIAKIAYRDIKSVIDKWEKENDCQFGIYLHWDRCITVDGEQFYEHELMDYEHDQDE